MEYHQYYGYNYYAEAMPLWGMAGYPVMFPPRATPAATPAGDAHLRSARELIGYRVEASDGNIGKVTDFLIDGRTWTIREVVVECGHWYAGQKIAIAAEKISGIDYVERTLQVAATKQTAIEKAER
jgi:hypothetical protein